jgi:UDP-glucose 4-epimerase
VHFVPFPKSDSIAVVGATSPLGQNLVGCLLDAGFFVHGFYRSLHKIPEFWKTHVAFQGAEFDLSHPAALAEALEAHKTIVWLAQSSDVSTTAGLDLNQNALSAVCSLAVRDHRKIILLSSGGAIYGNPDRLPVSEDDLCRPLSTYGQSKLRLEDTLRAGLEGKPNLSGVILRCGNIYGPNYLAPDAMGCIGAFTRSILNHQPVVLVDGGRTIRDFVHVDDVSRAIISAIMSDHVFAVWNVGCGVGTQIIRTLEMTSAFLGCAPAGVINVDAPPTDVKDIILNIERIERDCGWRPHIDLQEGLQAMLAPLREMKLTPGS